MFDLFQIRHMLINEWKKQKENRQYPKKQPMNFDEFLMNFGLMNLWWISRFPYIYNGLGAFWARWISMNFWWMLMNFDEFWWIVGFVCFLSFSLLWVVYACFFSFLFWFWCFLMNCDDLLMTFDELWWISDDLIRIHLCVGDFIQPPPSFYVLDHKP